ncbi:hypothetical protein D0T84_02375 [Dysgonomonas sp. 521]|uniref:hypothetical protein n=1 Tax=Dysgonomonas sp. 521 TaxID=2302932 RepID=UPI0013D78B13|nr:hypothetical protein [Dysgonomonas sp. 521]NDV93765.1 hypothetical protein [Dysgonomonas sp. 521]
MTDTGTFIEVNDIDEEIRLAILEEESKALELLSINKNNNQKEIVKKIREYVDFLLSGDINGYDEQKKKDISITLGSAWGMAVCETYGWKWQGLREEDEEYAAFFVVSPHGKFCCPPFGFIFNILNGANAGFDGKNDNTIMLLFNMLDNVEVNQSAPHNYTVLM